ncbi:hypothetical protein GM661_04390 [Iocasia frigidifontis]|uniref:Uncharacterized protein n=1 Tax=Iocasia fonsfrigidae TaxID=2682810 RepID=A0A8A7K671_9FIRM|nr:MULTISPECIES: hypothetical protein [Halanaerobiaceae]AZO94325.1 hypothetical protein D7D81_06780 [Halocella sp. SP3-1]QTL97273.1 hypothetical protein GM661_04390 [Iocasia fonsfrigidae]
MNMVESIINLIYENRVEDLDRLMHEKEIIELQEKAVNTNEFEERHDIIFQLNIMVSKFSYKTGFRDGLRLLIEIISIKE